MSGDAAGSAVRRAILGQLQLLEVAEGFFDAGVVLALAELRVFEAIDRDQRTTEELAAELEVDAPALRRLLIGGVAVKVLATDDGRAFRIEESVRSALLPGAGYLGNWLRNLAWFRDAIGHLAESVRTGEPTVALGESLAAGGPTRDFVLAMHGYASLRGRDLVARVDASGCSTLLDVGAGSGTYAFLLAAANPDLHVTLLDDERVLAVADEVRRELCIDAARVTYLPGDARTNGIPGSYDLVLVSNVLHMLGEDDSRRLLGRLYPVVSIGGSVVVQGQFLHDDGLGPRWPVMVDLVQLCMTQAGRNHSVAEATTWLEDAGFTDVEHHELSLLNANHLLRGWRRARSDVR